MEADINGVCSKICKPCRPELWETEDLLETQIDKALCRKATKVPLWPDGTFSVDRFYCDIPACECCGPRLKSQIVNMIRQNCSTWYNVSELMGEFDLLSIEAEIERAGSRWVAVGANYKGWLYITEKPVIKESTADIEVTLYRVGSMLQHPLMSKERRLRYSAGLFLEYTKMVESKNYILVKENRDWVREILRREGYTDSWKRKKTRDPDSPTGWGAEVEADMVQYILGYKGFIVLKVEPSQGK
jgi:hypothetical protein